MLTQYLTTFYRSAPVQEDMIHLLDDYIEEKDHNTNDTKYLRQFHKYLNHEYGVMNTDEVDEACFKKFLLYHVPKSASFLTMDKSKQLLKDMGFFMSSERLKPHKGVRRSFSNVYYEYLEEFPRIMALQKIIKNEMGYPVINFDPLIIDLEHYRKEKILDKYQDKSPIMEQGYFQVLEVFGSGIIIFKKLYGAEMFIKLHVGRDAIPYIRKNDIFHMRISRRLFFTTWNLDTVRSCYHNDALEYLKN